jgi:hypothetical protein
MKPKKITNERPLKVDKTFEEAMKTLANPPKKSGLIAKIRKAKKKG